MKDIDFDQGLVFVRGGKGDKDRSTRLADMGREELCAHMGTSDVWHRADREAGLAASGCPMRWSASTRMRAVNWPGSGCFPVTRRHQIQEYVGHANVEAAMIDTHVDKDLRNPARSRSAR